MTGRCGDATTVEGPWTAARTGGHVARRRRHSTVTVDGPRSLAALRAVTAPDCGVEA